MASFKAHKVTASALLGVIPEALLTHLSATTSVDCYTKVLHGKKMFYLLLYGILENDRLSQRTLEDTFNDSIFKTLFSLEGKEKLRRSPLSECLGKIDADFRQIYECIYGQFAECYSGTEQQKYNIIRVDRTVITDLSGKMAACVEHKRGKGAVKYSVAFDGILPCESLRFTDGRYACEDNALPEVVRGHVKRQAGHRNMYVFDRGLQSAQTMKAFSEEPAGFVARVKENRKYVEVCSLLSDEVDLGELTLITESKVY